MGSVLKTSCITLLPCSFREPVAHPHSMELQLLPLHSWPWTRCRMQRWAQMWPWSPSEAQRSSMSRSSGAGHLSSCDMAFLSIQLVLAALIPASDWSLAALIYLSPLLPSASTACESLGNLFLNTASTYRPDSSCEKHPVTIYYKLHFAVFCCLSGWHREGNRNKENATLANTSLCINALI